VQKYKKSGSFLLCDGKKTALLQAEVSACVSGLANVQFCAWAVHFFVFPYLSLSSKLSAVSIFTLGGNGLYKNSSRSRDSYLSSYTKVVAGCNP
jgi:hypothetical protein